MATFDVIARAVSQDIETAQEGDSLSHSEVRCQGSGMSEPKDRFWAFTVTTCRCLCTNRYQAGSPLFAPDDAVR
jgi:hypothetical protein